MDRTAFDYQRIRDQHGLLEALRVWLGDMIRIQRQWRTIRALKQLR
jgi:hypothetical protein